MITGVGEFNTCPLLMPTAESAALLRLYPYFEKGILPFAGGLLDQPNGVVQAMDIIRARVNENAAKRK